MKKTTSLKLSKQLAKYGALTVAIAGVADASGQISYTNIDPDFSGGVGGEYFLDLDNNGTNDFRIFHNNASSASSAAILISPLTASNDVLGTSGGTYAYPFVLNSGDVISSGGSAWNNNGFSGGFQSLNYGSSCSIGNWCGVTDGFIGLRFNIGGSTHYGWARLDVPTDNSTAWTIKDMAYNQTANQSILAGQQTLSVETTIFNDVKIVALNKSIGLYNLTDTANYKLFSMTGKQVLEGTVTDNTYVIEANTVASGVYIIELIDVNSKATIRKKVVL
ncbi:T9SS type A sorting domain-containing protein [Psychroserpens luteolus]|uniref:T9SS type A sorting domain-containing protein n=1 Tax=Psychroserpens luteolus TaxID=2855840 RepID=UPI001E565B99|nr:T9SS type A sorting domain-containing protein [Psychroserpens luteolus]MCD2258045.1 T9SS type A sorting domain-containing protein [Psychroserpens luteolus]